MMIETQPFGDDGVFIRFAVDSLDFNNVGQFKEAVQPAIHAKKIVLMDMSSLTFVDSSGLGALLSVLRTANDANSVMKLFGMAKPVRALFELVRMHRIFAIYDTEQDAIDALQV